MSVPDVDFREVVESAKEDAWKIPLTFCSREEIKSRYAEGEIGLEEMEFYLAHSWAVENGLSFCEECEEFVAEETVSDIDIGVPGKVQVCEDCEGRYETAKGMTEDKDVMEVVEQEVARERQMFGF